MGEHTGRSRTLGPVPACVTVAVAIQACLMRRAHIDFGLSFLVALTLVAGAWQLLAASLLQGRRDDRPWALTLLLVPGVLGAVQLAGEAGFGRASLLLFAIGVVAFGTARLGRPGAPFPCAAAGAFLGWAVCYAGFRWSWHRHDQLMTVAALSVAGVAALVVGLLQPAGRFLRLAGHPAAAPLYLFGAWACVTGPPRPEKPAGSFTADRPPVVLIVLDTVRADHLRSYGYSRDTMPALERFAARFATRFDRSLASASSSLASHGSMFTGLRPTRHGGHECDAVAAPRGVDMTALRSDVPTLAQMLRRAGYWTVGLSANFGHLAPHMGAGRGFEWYDSSPGWQSKAARFNPYRCGAACGWLGSLGRWYPFSDSQFFEVPAPVPDRRAGEIVDLALDTVRQAGPDSFFLFVNLFDAHQSFQPPAPWRALFSSGPRIERAKLESVAEGHPATAEEVRSLVGAYDSELRYLDSQLERLLSALERHPRFEEMLVVVVGDHGEGFGEHGLFNHGLTMYDELVRVPLFIKPGQHRDGLPAGGVSTASFQSVDVFPTVLEHAGIEVPAGIDGRPLGAGRTLSSSEAFVCFQQAARHRKTFMRVLTMVEAPPWKLIASSNGPAELYRVGSDPGEVANLAGKEPEVVRQLELVLGTLQGDRPELDPGNRLPPELIESLRALGYLN